MTVGCLHILEALAPQLQAVSMFTMLCIGVFSAIVGLAYILGARTAQSEARGRFVQLVMFLIVIKMLICVLLVVLHVKLNTPENKLFVIPFLMIYLIFTIFEVYVLERLARLKPEVKRPEQ